MLFRRPELEKDNPIAPQPYMGPRRRLAMARAASLGKALEVDDVKSALQNLMDAASRLVNGLPKAKKIQKDVTALRQAIAQAERVLVDEDHSRS